MLGIARTFARTGMNCEPVTVETDIKKGLPSILFTGMLAQETREAKERIRPAIVNGGFEYPMRRITINFSPAETIKTGTHFDLAIAVSILSAQKQILTNEKSVYFGELSLSGELKWIRGILPLVIEAIAAGYEKIYVPYDNICELTEINTDKIYPLKELSDLKNTRKIEFKINNDEGKVTSNTTPDYSDVKGQENLIDAFITAVAGHHHVLLIGPPGTGKTMCASRIPGIMPEMSERETLEVNMIYSIASLSAGRNWYDKRPFRTPHNTASTRAMIGGGPKLLPGEVSLSHNGVLFLDEFLEFHSDSLQALRTIIERKEVHISLRNGYSVYPAHFLLIAAANPCPCGYYDTEGGVCSCKETDVKKYRKKLKNPLTDRIDIQIKADRINYKALNCNHENIRTTADIKEKILSVRRIQSERYENESFKINSMITEDKIKTFCKLTIKGEDLLEKVVDDNILSARSCHKILKLSRTIADINGNERINEYDILEALSMRFLDFERRLLL